MIISGLEIIAFQRQNAIDELKNNGEPNSLQILKNAWQIATGAKDKMDDLNAPFDFFLKECIKNEQKQRNESEDKK